MVLEQVKSGEGEGMVDEGSGSGIVQNNEVHRVPSALRYTLVPMLTSEVADVSVCCRSAVPCQARCCTLCSADRCHLEVHPTTQLPERRDGRRGREEGEVLFSSP